MERIAIYVRVSTREQINGHSIYQQSDLCKDYIANNCSSTNVVTIYDDSGYS